MSQGEREALSRSGEARALHGEHGAGRLELSQARAVRRRERGSVGERMAGMALAGGDSLSIYMATGKLKHPRVFWIESSDRSVCWGKSRCESPRNAAGRAVPRRTDSTATAAAAFPFSGTPKSSSARS